MKFEIDNREETIFNALMSRQTKVEVDGVEFTLKSLKHDTYVNREKEAKSRAKILIQLLN